MVGQISSAQVESIIRAKNLPYHVDGDGDIVLELPHHEAIGRHITAWCMLTGATRSIYCIRVVTDKAIPQPDWGRAILLCNSWNRDYRWPKAYLYYQSVESAAGEIVLEGQLDVEYGITEQQLTDFTDGQLAAALQFWIRVQQAQEF